MKNSKVILIALLGLLVASCANSWTITVNSTFEDEFVIERSTIKDLAKIKDSDSDCEGIPLELAFYQNGIQVVDSIEFYDRDGKKVVLDDQALTNPVCLSFDGNVTSNEESIFPQRIVVNENEVVQDARKIQDVTATTAYALGLEMSGLTGTSLVVRSYQHVVLLFLDGFSFDTLQEAMKRNLVPNLIADSVIYPTISVFPPRTSTSSAAILTGLTPNQSGVYKSGIRKTDSLTLFDAATEKGLTSIAVEGESLAFNLRNTEAILSGDRDQNGSTDDNTAANALAALKEGIPNLTWIHFHGIDDRGHTYGPITEEVLEKVAEIDTYIGQILEILPEDTLIISFADHGMHSINEEDELGNHGNLIYSDMVIPIIIKTK